MKKKNIGKLFLAILTLSCGLVSCDKKTSENSNETSKPTENTNSESKNSEHQDIDGHFDLWTKEQQELMKTYCGEILPYPVGLFSGKVTVEEVNDYSNDLTYLEIRDESTYFSIIDYYQYLEDFEWNAIRTYGGEVIQESSGTSFAEVTKGSSDKKVGYDLMYFFSPKQELDRGEEIKACNVIRCYNDMSASNNNAKAWSTDEQKSIKKVTTEILPFIALGSDYKVNELTYNAMEIFDYYVNDLTKEYSEKLKENGYVLDEKLSEKNDAYVLTKKLSNGSYIDIMLYYSNGNNFKIYYTPKVTNYNAWPTEIISQIKEKSGVEVPKFDVAENGTYSIFIKNDTYYISTLNRSSSFDYDEYALNQLQILKMTWDETVNFATYDLTDTDGTVVGYQVVISVTEPTSTFVTSWPNDVIQSTLSSLLNVSDVTIPVLDSASIPDTGKKIKYEIKGQEAYDSKYKEVYDDIKSFPGGYGLPDGPTEEQIAAVARSYARKEQGIDISIYDVNFQAYKAFYDMVYKAAWYKESDNTFEDPTGKITLTVTGDSVSIQGGVGEMKVTIRPGSNKKHTPEFYFTETACDVAIGHSKKLELISNMLPYEITYSSSDSTGKITVDQEGNVSVASDVEEGTTTIIKAEMNVPGESSPKVVQCTVTAKNILVYTPSSAIDGISSLIKGKGYTPSVTHTSELDWLEVNFGSAVDVETVKSLVTSDFIAEGFTLDTDWEVTEEDEPRNATIYSFMNLEYESMISVWYYVYQQDGNTILRVEAL